MEHTTRRFGPMLKRLRTAKGMTAEHLARQVGVTENAIRKLEAGDSKEPRFSTGLRLAVVLGAEPQTLMGHRSRSVNRKNGPDLAMTIRQIRSSRDQLTEKGVGHLSIFGSVARGDAMPKSDIDIIIEPSSPNRFTLFDLGRVTELLERVLAKHVDVLTAETLAQSRFAREANEEAVSVF